MPTWSISTRSGGTATTSPASPPAWPKSTRPLPGLLGELAAGDVAIWCADHGVDPTTASTDHSREYAPLLAWGLRGGRYDGLFEDVGATAYRRLTGLEPPLRGSVIP